MRKQQLLDPVHYRRRGNQLRAQGIILSVLSGHTATGKEAAQLLLKLFPIGKHWLEELTVHHLLRAAGPKYSSRAGEKISWIRVRGCPLCQKMYSLPQNGPLWPNRLQGTQNQNKNRGTTVLLEVLLCSSGNQWTADMMLSGLNKCSWVKKEARNLQPRTSAAGSGVHDQIRLTESEAA